MPTFRPLTPRMLRFVDEYLIDLHAQNAAIRAGYSKPTAKQIGYQLINKPPIAAEIAKRKAVLAKKAGVSQEWVMERLIENVGRAMQAEPVKDATGATTGEYRYDGGVANRGLELLGKHIGMFVERTESSGGVTVTIVRADK